MSSMLLSLERLFRSLLRRLYFVREFLVFRELSRHSKQRFPLLWKDIYPFLKEKTQESGFDRHYFYHTAWAARTLVKTNPKSHIDIGSHVFFAGMMSAFLPFQFFDYRPATIQLDNLTSGAADLVNLPFKSNSVSSLSCMHVVEHIGLGRYGDPLDYDGDQKAMSELSRVLAQSGNLLFVVPVGKPKILFNAHRIYSYRQVIDSFSSLTLKEFSLVPDNPSGGLIRYASEQLANNQHYGCGCFWFVKP